MAKRYGATTGHKYLGKVVEEVKKATEVVKEVAKDVEKKVEKKDVASKQ